MLSISLSLLCCGLVSREMDPGIVGRSCTNELITFKMHQSYQFNGSFWRRWLYAWRRNSAPTSSSFSRSVKLSIQCHDLEARFVWSPRMPVDWHRAMLTCMVAENFGLYRKQRLERSENVYGRDPWFQDWAFQESDGLSDEEMNAFQGSVCIKLLGTVCWDPFGALIIGPIPTNAPADYFKNTYKQWLSLRCASGLRTVGHRQRAMRRISTARTVFIVCSGVTLAHAHTPQTLGTNML